MKTVASLITALAILGGGGSLILAQGHAHVIQTPSEAAWGPAPPMLPAGAQIAVLSGDPTRSVPYAVRLKFPANYAIPAHSHPTDENVVVTSGALVFGMGDVLDTHSGANTKLTVGGFVDASANVNHFAFTRDEETTIVLYGEGPVEFNYVNPNDDPRNQPNTARRQ